MKSEKTQCVRTKNAMCWANIALLSLALCCGSANAFVVKKLCEGKTKPSVEEANVYRLICDENYDQTGVGQELEQVDMILNGYYRAARERSADKEALLKNQKAWLKERNACKNMDCLRRAYHRRIMELAEVPAKATILDLTYKAISEDANYILTRENGLKQFDGGKSDFDVAVALRFEEDATRQCNRTSYYLVGSDITVKTRCETSEYGVYKPAITEDGKSFQFLVSYQPSRYFSEEKYVLPLLNGSKIFDKTIPGQFWPASNGRPSTNEPFQTTISSTNPDGAVIWHWVLVSRNTKNSKERQHSLATLWRWIPLPDSSILSTNYSGTTFRLDPTTGKPYDKDHFRVFPVDQAIAWRKAWAQDYVRQTPSCQGDIRRCPDKKAASDYLFKRFDEEMAHQFGDALK